MCFTLLARPVENMGAYVYYSPSRESDCAVIHNPTSAPILPPPAAICGLHIFRPHRTRPVSHTRVSQRGPMLTANTQNTRVAPPPSPGSSCPSQLIAMLLYHEKNDPNKKISLYFNCPGALIRPALAIYDTLMHMQPELSTLNLGLATGMVSFLCAAGKRGERYALPNSRFLMQRTGMEDPYQGQASDIGVEVSRTCT